MYWHSHSRDTQTDKPKQQIRITTDLLDPTIHCMYYACSLPLTVHKHEILALDNLSTVSLLQTINITCTYIHV